MFRPSGSADRPAIVQDEDGPSTSGPESGHLARNLAALRAHRPQVADQVESAPRTGRFKLLRVTGGAISIADVSDPARPLILTPGADPLAALKEGLLRLDPVLASGQPLALLGVGDGYLLSALARRPPDLFMDQQLTVHLVEPHLELLRLVLTLHDYSGPAGPIQQEWFHWHVGDQWANAYGRFLVEEAFVPPPVVFVQQSPDGTALRERAERALSARTDLETRLQQRVNTYYASRTVDDLVAILGADPPRPPRVLLLTSRFTTVLQYSARDAREGFERNRWETRLLIEPSPHTRCTSAAILQELDAFRPDVLFILDHLRASLGPMIPPNLLHATWVQDLLPNLMSRAAGASVGPRDFVLTFATPLFVDDLGYAASQCIDVPMMMAPLRDGQRGAENGTTEQRDARHVHNENDIGLGIGSKTREASDPRFPDLVYVSNLSARTPMLVDEVLRRVGQSLGPLAQAMCDWLVGEYARGSSIHTKYDIRKRLDEVAGHLGLQALDSSMRRSVVDVLWNPLNIGLYRQQALGWVVTAAEDLGLTLGVYGRGWDGHDAFARFARGPVAPGRDLDVLTRRARINLNLEPYPCVTHKRLLAGLTAGGFFLVRDHPSNALMQDLADFLHEHVDPKFRSEIATVEDALAQVDADLHQALSDLIEHARCLCFSDRADPVAQVGCYERAGVIVPGQDLLPHLRDVSFADAPACRDRIERFADDPGLRSGIRDRQARVVRRRLGIDVGIERICDRMRQVLESEAARCTVPEAIPA